MECIPSLYIIFQTSTPVCNLFSFTSLLLLRCFFLLSFAVLPLVLPPHPTHFTDQFFENYCKDCDSFSFVCNGTITVLAQSEANIPRSTHSPQSFSLHFRIHCIGSHRSHGSISSLIHFIYGLPYYFRISYRLTLASPAYIKIYRLHIISISLPFKKFFTCFLCHSSSFVFPPSSI